MIRECFIPRAGWLYCSTDYSMLEACTLAQVTYSWFGYSKMREAINAGQDLHLRLAARIKGVTYEEAQALRKAGDSEIKNLRQAAKPCLGPDTRVLTSAGWKRIVEVQSTDLLWDGVEWVTHQGLVDKGVKETWAFQGLSATADHAVWTCDGWQEWLKVLTSRSLFKQALYSATLPSSRGSRSSLARAGVPGITQESGVLAGGSSPSSGTSCLQDTRRGALTATESHSSLTGPSASRSYCLTPSTEHAYSPDYQQPLVDVTTSKLGSMHPTADGGSSYATSGGQTAVSSSSTFSSSRGGTPQSSRWIAWTTIAGTSLEISGSRRLLKTLTIEGPYETCRPGCDSLRQRMPTYDLACAGPRNRYTVLTDQGPLIVHNCNFGLPGLMAPPKICFTARKDGVRFCELAGVLPEGQCGSNGKAIEWKGRTIAPTCTECLHLAKRYSEIWFSEYPEVREYHQRTIAMARAGERGVPLETHHTGMLRLVESANAASNHQFQALGAAGAKHSAWLLSKEMHADPSSVLYNNAHLVVFVHDETFTELREEVAHECALRQAEIMISGMREFCPDVTITCAPALARRWFKGAEAVYDRAGRLKPWWPKDQDWQWGPDQEQMRKDKAA